ncbi:hypothetical protein [Pseudomonas putida]|nr:hypothetical protein [Pseudomonas putida]
MSPEHSGTDDHPAEAYKAYTTEYSEIAGNAVCLTQKLVYA